VKHTSEQDLLLLAHRALGIVPSLEAHFHMLQCAECRSHFAELKSVSLVAASAMRVGMPKWKPAGMALGLKLVILAAAATATAVGTRTIIQRISDPPLEPAPGISATAPQPPIVQPRVMGNVPRPQLMGGNPWGPPVDQNGKRMYPKK
jgi:hypothetical protein